MDMQLHDKEFFSTADDAIQRANYPDRASYVTIWFPDHPLANATGYVVAARLTSEEFVYHLDGNRQNLAPDNLKILSRAELMAFNYANARRSGDETLVNVICSVCESAYTVYAAHVHWRKTCSTECNAVHRSKFQVTKGELQELVILQPMIMVAENLGASDKAVGKRCKKLEILRPPRGYWRKIEAKRLDTDMETALLLEMLDWVKEQGDDLKIDAVGQRMLADVLDKKLSAAKPKPMRRQYLWLHPTSEKTECRSCMY